MRTASAALKTLLANGTQFLLADCLTIVPTSGATIRLTNADHDITVASRYPTVSAPANQTFLSGGMGKGPTFSRGQTKLVSGVEVDRTQVHLFTDPLTQTYGGVPYPAAARAGAFDEATIVIEKIVTASWTNLSAGTFVVFWGRTGRVTPKRNVVTLEVLSYLDLLTQQPLPKNLYQPGCLHTLYDAGCTLNPATFVVAGAATGGSTASVINSALGNPDAYFEQGVLTFTSGVLNGQTRTVKSYVGGVFSFALPFSAAPAAADTFNAYPGCSKTQATCSNKFGNLAHFRGFPYIPDPMSGL